MKKKVEHTATKMGHRFYDDDDDENGEVNEIILIRKNNLEQNLA